MGWTSVYLVRSSALVLSLPRGRLHRVYAILALTLAGLFFSKETARATEVVQGRCHMDHCFYFPWKIETRCRQIN